MWPQRILPLTFPEAADDRHDYDDDDEEEEDDDHADSVLFTITSERDTKSGIHYSLGEGLLMKAIGMYMIKAVFTRTIHFFCSIQHTAYIEPNKQHISHVESIVPRPVHR